jgi:hypothetical protein
MCTDAAGEPAAFIILITMRYYPEIFMEELCISEKLSPHIRSSSLEGRSQL